MGYQVGRICYAAEEEAVNVLMTQVVPTIDKDGVLNHPVFKGSAWEYKGQIVKPTLPQCEFGAYAQAGKEIGIGLVGATTSLLIVVIALRTVSMIGKRDEE
ncbi:hypothetical protein [Neisseria weaveri]|uniref:hypothetical protein n=1 Tax=Neisseria weaveri TaxID=28091 RepID=UPI000D30697A|nr:hypothetical protein [Neisseria weaveri]